MFPWLPFLTSFPPQHKSTRSRRRLRKVYQETRSQKIATGEKAIVHCIDSILKIEYISHPATTSCVQQLEAVKLAEQHAELVQQQKEAIKARQRASFETSTEMLELFGGEVKRGESAETNPFSHKLNGISLEGASELPTKDLSPPNSYRKVISPISRKVSPAPVHTSPPSSSQAIRTLSPVEQPKLNSTAVNTPPAVRAAKARQKAFQPSSAMLEMFAGDAEYRIVDDSRKPVARKKVGLKELSEKEQLNGTNGCSGGTAALATKLSNQDPLPHSPSTCLPLISEPGPEHFEGSSTKASTSSCSSSEQLSPTQEEGVHHPTTRSNGHSKPELKEHCSQKDKQRVASSRCVNALSSSSPFYNPVSAPIQLSDPGPELPFDDEEEEEGEEEAVHETNGQHIIQQAVSPKPHNYAHREGQEQENLAGPHSDKTYIEEKTDIPIKQPSIKGERKQGADPSLQPVNNNINSLPACKLSDGAGEKTGGDWKKTSGAFSFSSPPKEPNLFGGGAGSGAGGAGGMDTAASEGGGSGAGGAGAGAAPSLLIRNAQIINDDEMFAADIWIENGIIKKISSKSLKAPEGAEVIEANGRWVLPAGIDVHTQFSTNSSSEDFSAGTKAALAGGTTTIIDTVFTRNESESLLAAFDRIRSTIPGKANCNVGLSVVVSQWKGEKTCLEMSQLVREKGINSFILELTSDSEMFEALEHSKEIGAHCRILPENKEMAAVLEKRLTQQQKGLSPAEIYVQARPAKLEAEQIHRVCVLSQLVNCPFSVLSVTSSEASQAVRNGRKEGVLVSAEVPVAALAAIVDSSASKGPLTRIPLRPQSAHSEDALELLANNSMSMCVSDHHITKSASTLNGVVKTSSLGILPSSAGIEQRMSVLWEKAVVQFGKLDPMRFVAVTSSNAAKMFNTYPRKGRVAVGSDADLVLWDFDSSRVLSSCPLTPFHQMTVHATPVTTICGGKVLYSNGKFVGPATGGQTSKTGDGQDYFLCLEANSPHVFGMVQLREKTFNLSMQAIGRGKPEHEVEDSAQSRRTSVASSVCSGIIDERPKPGSSSNTTLNKKTAESNTRSSTASSSRNRNIQSNDPPKRSTTKVIHPPGGKSTGFW